MAAHAGAYIACSHPALLDIYYSSIFIGRRQGSTQIFNSRSYISPTPSIATGAVRQRSRPTQSKSEAEKQALIYGNNHATCPQTTTKAGSTAKAVL